MAIQKGTRKIKILHVWGNGSEKGEEVKKLKFKTVKENVEIEMNKWKEEKIINEFWKEKAEGKRKRAKNPLRSSKTNGEMIVWRLCSEK